MTGAAHGLHRVRFQADADLNRRILLAVTRLEPAIDFQSAHAVGLEGLADGDVLALAAAAGRILVTHDRRTMPHHFAEFIADRQCPGVLIVPQRLPVAEAAAELVLIWSSTDAEEWIGRICGLPL